MRLTEKDINYIVNECINKLLVKESLSSVVYHFCSIGKALQICESDVFKLQSVFSAISDNLSKRGKMFYMSFTRQYNGTLGYSRGKHVRITFDGDMLNQKFNGKPVDYWGVSMGKQRYYTNPNDFTGVKNSPIDSHQSNTESEDRLFSDKPLINNITRYIKKIDVLIDPVPEEPNGDGKNPEWLKRAQQSYQNKLETRQKQIIACYQLIMTTNFPVSVYDNPQDFNSLTPKNDIAPQIKDNYNLWGQNPFTYDTDKMPSRAAYNIKQVLEFILTGEYNYKDMKQEAAKLLSKYGLQLYTPYVLQRRIEALPRWQIENSISGIKTLHYDLDAQTYEKVANMLADYAKSKGARNLRELINYKINN